MENDSHYFSLYSEKPSICNVSVKLHGNWPVHCWDIAFYKKDGRKLPSPTLPVNTCVLDGATDRGVVRLGSQHHLCSSESVAYLPSIACWWRTLWTLVATATTTVTDIYRLNWYQRCPVLETCVFISSKLEIRSMERGICPIAVI